MRSAFKFTLAALIVSLSLTACKSNSPPSVVIKDQRIPINDNTKEKEDGNRDDKGQANGQDQTDGKDQTDGQDQTDGKDQTDGQDQTDVDNDGSNDPKISFGSEKAIDTDGQGRAFRVVNLKPGKSVINASQNRRSDFDSFTDSSVNDSPFDSDENNKEYNHFLTFDLGTSDGSDFTRINDKNKNHLGVHRGSYNDSKLKGNTAEINYLYVNQPYSSYGALFTDAKDSHLFHVRLNAGKDSSVSGESEAEYGVFTQNGKNAKWNDNLVGNATYKGQAIARVIRKGENKNIAETPKFDGTVTLNLELVEAFEGSTLSGEIHSNTLGKIILQESRVRNSNVLKNNIGFGEEAFVEDDEDITGIYSVDFTGPNLNEAVGMVELDNEADDIPQNGVVKYNAVFGASKFSK